VKTIAESPTTVVFILEDEMYPSSKKDEFVTMGMRRRVLKSQL
jgi:hypothetical protein